MADATKGENANDKPRRQSPHAFPKPKPELNIEDRLSEDSFCAFGNFESKAIEFSFEVLSAGIASTGNAEARATAERIACKVASAVHHAESANQPDGIEIANAGSTRKIANMRWVPTDCQDILNAEHCSA